MQPPLPTSIVRRSLQLTVTITIVGWLIFIRQPDLLLGQRR
jgi:hypothetical protein